MFIVQREVPQRSVIRRFWILQCHLVRALQVLYRRCSLICPVRRSGWDIHDTTYSKELLISNRANGFRDLLSVIDLSTYRRIPWENNVPFFLVSFLDPDTKQPICADPRGVLKRVVDRAESKGWQCYAGCEYEVSRQLYAVCI